MRLIAILSLSFILLGSSGCASFKPLDPTALPPKIKVAAYLGTWTALQRHPEWRPGFELASQEMAVLEQAETFDWATILAIVHRLPVDKLQSERATVYITAATLLLDSLDLQTENPERLRAIATALRQGIDLALGPTVPAPAQTP